MMQEERNLAETEGFEPSVQYNPYYGLANRYLRPLGHVSVLVFIIRCDAFVQQFIDQFHLNKNNISLKMDLQTMHPVFSSTSRSQSRGWPYRRCVSSPGQQKIRIIVVCRFCMPPHYRGYRQ